MPQRNIFYRSRTFGRVGGAILLGLLILSCLALVGSAISFDRRLGEVRDANSDNQGWIVSQLEVDHLALMLATSETLEEMREGGGAVPDARWRSLVTEFDIFYSRVTVFLAAMRAFEVSPEFEARLTRLNRLRIELAEEIDALDPGDMAGLQGFRDALAAETDLVRGVVTTGLQFFIDTAQQAREREREIWQYFLMQTLGLLALILAAAFLSARLNHALEHRSIAAERAASTVLKAYEAMLSAVVVTTFDGRILLFNRSAERMFRISASDVIGDDTSMQFVPRRLRRFVRRTIDEAMRHAARQDSVRISRRTLARRFDGEIFPIELSVTNDVDHDGRRILITFIRDISEQVRTENAMRTAVDEARRAAAAKSMFLATMSHEMRTPLHGLIAALELMDPRGFDADTRNLYDTALNCSEQALSQINDVLQFTRATALRETSAPFLPARIVSDLLGQLGPYAKEQGNTIEMAITGAGGDTRVLGYPNAFSRALYNLIGNAVKFTTNGRVRVELTFRETGPDDAIALRVAVIDEGPGIAEADHERIFRLFETTADPSDAGGATGAAGSSNLWGTGLGLPITKIAVETMKSEIRLDSAPGKGSRFWFDLVLPRATGADAVQVDAPPADAPAEDATTRDRRKVLVVDDNEVNRTLMLRMVERLGHRTASARNGREAVDLARETRFDVILMDVNMPVMNGCDASLAIREAGASRAAVIIGVTALMEAEDAGLFHEFGMATTLVKPVKPATLAATFAAVARGDFDMVDLAEDDKEQDDAAEDEMLAPELDIDDLAGLVGADTARRLLAATLEDAAAALAAARAGAADSGDLAHKAAGAAAMVGWARLAAALREIEHAALDAAPDGRQQLCDRLAARLAEARAELAACDGYDTAPAAAAG